MPSRVFKKMKKILSSQTFYEFLKMRALWSKSLFSIFSVFNLWPKSENVTFLKCQKTVF